MGRSITDTFAVVWLVAGATGCASKAGEKQSNAVVVSASRVAAHVAQVCNLPYRRFAIGFAIATAPKNSNALGAVSDAQNAILRYGAARASRNRSGPRTVPVRSAPNVREGLKASM
ncbi:MAG: hypothetical protein L0Z50_20655, partial [Verrucomicrobiales bacterium]|nr:hypothetical protein [Verrucomicrobiales bacterium]